MWTCVSCKATAWSSGRSPKFIPKPGKVGKSLWESSSQAGTAFLGETDDLSRSAGCFRASRAWTFRCPSTHIPTAPLQKLGAGSLTSFLLLGPLIPASSPPGPSSHPIFTLLSSLVCQPEERGSSPTEEKGSPCPRKHRHPSRGSHQGRYHPWGALENTMAQVGFVGPVTRLFLVISITIIIVLLRSQ